MHRNPRQWKVGERGDTESAWRLLLRSVLFGGKRKLERKRPGGRPCKTIETEGSARRWEKRSRDEPRGEHRMGDLARAPETRFHPMWLQGEYGCVVKTPPNRQINSHRRTRAGRGEDTARKRRRERRRVLKASLRLSGPHDARQFRGQESERDPLCGRRTRMDDAGDSDSVPRDTSKRKPKGW